MKSFERKDRVTRYIKFMYDGKRRYVDTQETVAWKADRVAEHKRLQWIEQYEAKTNLSMQQLEDWDFTRYSLKRDDTKHWASSIGLQWRRLREFFKEPDKITHDALEGYLKFRKLQRKPDGSPQWTAKTLKGHLVTLRRGLTIARDNKGFGSLHIPKNWPMPEVKANRKGMPYASNDYATHELRAIIAVLQGHAQDTALFLACTGMRAEEAEKVSMAHFKAMPNMDGCAGVLVIPEGAEDEARTIGIPHGLLPIMQRAIPFTTCHRKIFKTACKAVTGKDKFGRRDFRAGFITALARIDPFGAHMAAGHSQGVRGRYHNWEETRMSAIAVAAWEAFAPDQTGGLGSGVVSIVGSKAYQRKRLVSGSGL